MPPQHKKRKPSAHSGLADHQRKGNTLTPPLLKVDPSLFSWRDQRLPEMLWSVLLAAHLPRSTVLNIFRDISNFIYSLAESDRFYDVSHTAIAHLDPSVRQSLLSIIVADDECK